MKKVLFATTALVMTAGFAAAEVSVGGDGRMGIISKDGADLGFTSRIRISFAASGETDSGLSFGGSVRADNAGDSAEGGGKDGTGGSVFIEGSFGKITMGDTDSAAKAAVGQVSGVGLTGLDDLNEVAYIGNGGAERPSARWDYAVGDLGLHVSADNPASASAADESISVAVTYSAGDISFGIGLEDDDTVGSHVIAGVSAAFGDATVKAIYGDTDMLGDGDQYALSLDYVTGATTITAFFSENTDAEEHYGLGVAYDLGGGASIKGGLVDGDGLTDMSYDFGISMSF